MYEEFHEDFGFAYDSNVVCRVCMHLTSAGLPFSTLGKTFSRRRFEIFFLLFSQERGFEILCDLSLMETIGTKCQILFSKKVIKLHALICRLLICPESGKGYTKLDF